MGEICWLWTVTVCKLKSKFPLGSCKWIFIVLNSWMHDCLIVSDTPCDPIRSYISACVFAKSGSKQNRKRSKATQGPNVLPDLTRGFNWSDKSLSFSASSRTLLSSLTHFSRTERGLRNHITRLKLHYLTLPTSFQTLLCFNCDSIINYSVWEMWD